MATGTEEAASVSAVAAAAVDCSLLLHTNFVLPSPLSLYPYLFLLLSNCLPHCIVVASWPHFVFIPSTNFLLLLLLLHLVVVTVVVVVVPAIN